ncbi:MAG: hypothetical protein K0Q95_2632 [Bacteroidota bacterium]|jgi:uncharacterized membrane protein YbhN (UPF0104 family)|nr:hypothetical protein [Bacteroidota bacterium]
MNLARNNRIYKVTSLFIKAAILILSFVYIFHKFQTSQEEYQLSEVLKNSDLILLSVSFLLMFVNWGLESLKWQYLIRPLEKISFGDASRAVYAGVTVSIFMPNRIGEFAGRIFFLEKADKIGACLKNFIGGFIQLLITLVVGLAAIFIAIRQGYLDGFIQKAFTHWSVTATWLLLIIGLVALIILNRRRSLFSERMQKYFQTVFDTPNLDILIVLLLSVLRYFVFFLQYYFVLQAFGIETKIFISFVLIAITFFITTMVPSFAFTEIATRGAAAAYLFSSFTNNTAAVITASFVVWIINLAIPALIGSVFIGKLKFFKSDV